MRRFSRPEMGYVGLRLLVVVAGLLMAQAARATTVVPISDADLQARADVVVHGVVASSEVTVDGAGRPETLTFIEPLAVLKGSLGGPLVLHQLGGILPDGRFLQMFGRPEYFSGREVVVFAIRRPEGEFQTAEMMLGKFEIRTDAAGAKFAVPDLAIASLDGVVVRSPQSRKPGSPRGVIDTLSGPRPLDRFLSDVRTGHFSAAESLVPPKGALEPVVHARVSQTKTPQWGYINNSLYRYTNNATNAWTISGSSNVTGGGTSQATAAIAVWTNDPYTNINYTAGSGTSSIINLAAPTSGCGWSTCLDGNGGVIGCGGPSGGGSNSWRGDTYYTISGGHVDVRPFCTTDQWAFVLQSVIEHELGHTLGLGHSDQNVSVHDACRGDEDAAIMRSIVQNRNTLGTDDQAAIRWLYGDGSNSCTAAAGPPAPSGLTPSFGTVSGGTVVTIVGSGFQPGASVTFGGAPATSVSVSGSTSITATTPAHAAGPVSVVVANPDAQSGTLSGGFTYSTGADFYTVTPCRLLDTRNPQGPLGGPSLAANGDRSFLLAGQCGVPATAKALSLNVTVTQGSTGGDLRLSATGGAMPQSSSINYRAGQTRANNVISAVSPTGSISVHCDQGAGSVHMIVDVNGYFQ